MVKRIYAEKKEGLRVEADALLGEIRDFLGIGRLTGLRILNRYDAEKITDEVFGYAMNTVFSEPQQDDVYTSVPSGADEVFAVEFLPGQFDQRADSAAQCIQILSQGERPTVRSAKVYLLYGALTPDDVAAIKKYVMNPVEAREASLELPETLETAYEKPTRVETLSGFNKLSREELSSFVKTYGLAMDADDIAFCQDYFRSEERDPTITEIRMIDTYWSDHCRHTTFNTEIDSVTFEDGVLEAAWKRYLDVRASLGRAKPVCLMDIATLAAKYLKQTGKLKKLDESEEINACTVKIDVEVDGVKEPWLLLFKNETHNHPTEIEPFGGAATCIGGAIRDPLSGRGYVYAAMRVTGAADPTRPVGETIPGKLPQKKLVTTAAAGYSSYGNQIGLATGVVDELYHPGYAAKRLEIGAVIAAAPAKNVRREVPSPGDKVILLGGATGRDGIGGATGSSKAHTAQSVETCGAEVQKGNAPEERKLQRLFRKEAVTRLIKRCNDFGAGGVSVAIGELADGLVIDLNKVPKKYEGLDGTELAISESQERMAVVVEEKDVPAFLAAADEENLSATVVAEVTAEPRLRMTWNGETIVNVSRAFLDSNGAPKHIDIAPAKPRSLPVPACEEPLPDTLRRIASDLNTCSKQGLSERFDATIGAGTVLMPFGGRFQRTPIGAMAHKISVERGHTDDVSLMAWGYDPFVSERSPFHGAYDAVVESVAKLIAAGAPFRDVYLSLQEYFEKPGRDPKRWGKPLAALLGAFSAQLDLGVAAIGGKDSMSGSFEDLDVPPTLVSFAVTTSKAQNVVSPEFKTAGNGVVLLAPKLDARGLPETNSLISVFDRVTGALRSCRAVSAAAVGKGGVAESVMKSAFGNGFGFAFGPSLTTEDLTKKQYGAILLEVTEVLPEENLIGYITAEPAFTRGEESVPANELLALYESRLEGVYPLHAAAETAPVPTLSCDRTAEFASHIKTARPRVLIPAFPGTNCEYDSAKAFADAGAEPEIFVVRNRSAADIRESVASFAEKLKQANVVFIPGGFSGGDEPEGSAKFITAFFRSAPVKDGVHELLKTRDGLMAGICNGFQALIKLGLVPYGEIVDPDENSPTLTFNTIGRHQSMIVKTRVASVLSPWLSGVRVGDIVNVPISHGEGRFICPAPLLRQLAENGQIATQYVDLSGSATMDDRFNPNGSVYAVEGILSPDGRVLGKMGHSERKGSGLYLNVPGNYDLKLFESAVGYYK
ncbi:MAG: phosphoribosylformylglycinamidine synthase [Clostridia bacterium]|nr:phosphoribosylformylglycinamidine synthase [Clostridia bacterium]